ncbi:MAG: hypothetical protein CMI56_02275 [Parcubacteria group bacterium]|nr:hypothetical protein [Parcubacteria group bacterium]
MSWQTIVKENNIDANEVYSSKLFGSLRIDAECYQQKYLGIDFLLSKKSTKPLGEYAKITDGDHSKFPEDQKEDVRYLRSKDIKNYFLVDNDPVFVSKEYFNKQKRSHIFGENILISIMGNVGDITITPKDFDTCIANRAVCILKNININPYFLFAYLISDVANLNIERLKTGGVQERINLEILQTLPIPISQDENLNKKIEDFVVSAHKVNEQSKKSLSEAEQMLLKEINLEGYKASDEGVAVRNFSEALADNRFDAEYWQPDYDVILDTLSVYKKGVSTIGDEFKQIKNNFKKDKEKEYNYIEIGDVNVSTGEVEHNSVIGAELPANAKIKFGKRQLITSKVRPNRGATAILDNHEGYIGSGAFTVLTEQESINLETLMVYLKTQPIRELLLRYNTGTSYPVITDADVLKLPIPLIDKSVQKKISELVSVSATERQEAKMLLEKAKRAVEIFVEKDEKEAIAFINK